MGTSKAQQAWFAVLAVAALVGVAAKTFGVEPLFDIAYPVFLFSAGWLLNEARDIKARQRIKQVWRTVAERRTNYRDACEYARWAEPDLLPGMQLMTRDGALYESHNAVLLGEWVAHGGSMETLIREAEGFQMWEVKGTDFSDIALPVRVRKELWSYFANELPNEERAAFQDVMDLTGIPPGYMTGVPAYQSPKWWLAENMPDYVAPEVSE